MATLFPSSPYQGAAWNVAPQNMQSYAQPPQVTVLPLQQFDANTLPFAIPPADSFTSQPAQQRVENLATPAVTEALQQQVQEQRQQISDLKIQLDSLTQSTPLPVVAQPQAAPSTIKSAWDRYMKDLRGGQAIIPTGLGLTALALLFKGPVGSAIAGAVGTVALQAVARYTSPTLEE